MCVGTPTSSALSPRPIDTHGSLTRRAIPTHYTPTRSTTMNAHACGRTWPFLVVLCVAGVACASTDPDPDPDPDTNPEAVPCHAPAPDESVIAVATGEFQAPRSAEPLEIDGCSRDAVWAAQDWHSLDYPWMGGTPDPADYQGRFKLAWTTERLHLLVEVVDDVLTPTLADGLENYWKGDYVEVFLDEDRSGGNHQYNHQAFAYHVSTEGHAIDKDTARETVLFDDHVEVVRTQEGDRYLWEMAIKVFSDDFDESRDDNTPVTLSAGKSIGFSLAYGDNDGNSQREHFMGSRETHGVNNDEGYINADVFGSVELVE